MQAVSWILWITGLYSAIGLVFALVFVAIGGRRVDSAAVGAPLLFRALIFPGVAAMWPLMLIKWKQAELRGPKEIHS